MVKTLQMKMSLTREIPFPTEYTTALLEENLDYNYDEERAPKHKGLWRQEGFKVAENVNLDLEIGTGNGFHFAHRAQSQPERRIIGIELKYKPLIQSVRRALKLGATNFKMLRYDANFIDDIFAFEELNNIFIHFPDPWPKKRHWKNRLLRASYLNKLYELQQPGSLLEFKTDHFGYFEWALEEVKNSKYEVIRHTEDLHASQWAQDNYITHFENLWMSKGLPIHYILLRKP